MKKTALALVLVLVIIFSIVAGILLVDWEEAEEVKLYTFPLSVREETYIVTVRSNYSVSKVSYFGPLRYVTVNFFGSERATVFCNITVPTDLIWGDISVHHQDYKQPDDKYVLFSNATHHFVQIIFNHIATVEQISLMGTEGVPVAELITSPPS